MKRSTFLLHFRMALLLTIALLGAVPAYCVITGTTTFCAGTTSALTDTAAGGTWTSGATAIATVGASSGVVTGVSAGTVTITHTAASGVYTIVLSIETTPTAGTISGVTFGCGGAVYTLTDGVSGGVWSSGNTAIATVDASGGVTPVTSGTVSISYTVTNTCSSATATQSFTSDVVDPGVISGPTAECMYVDFPVTESVGGGTWGSTDLSIVYTDPFSSIYGVAPGSCYITYDVNDGTCNATAYYLVTVDSIAYARSITGPSLLCVGSTGTLSDTSTGGAWSSSNTTVATIDASGLVTGATIGATVISYIITNSCGADTATFNLSVGTAPVAATISGPTVVCTGFTITLSSTATGGAWSSSTTAVATVDASGVVYGSTPGTVDIYYTTTTACGTAIATYTVTVNLSPAAGSISGPSSVCAGSSVTLTDGSTGGTWSSSASGIATISTGGVVTGVTTGSATISYGVSTTCGTVYATHAFTVNPMPNAGTITGSTGVCTGTITALADAAGGGAWSSGATGIATVDASGNVTGVAVGTVVISYTVTNGCGTAYATQTETVVLSAAAGSISGSTTVCEGSSTTLTDAATGGVWSSNASGVATISTGGVVTGVTAGSATISYTVTTGCGVAYATYAFTVNPMPNAGSITGASTLCTGLTTSLTESATGGTWSSSATGVATVDATGFVTSIAPGAVSIVYTVTNGCGTATASHSMTVILTPSVSAISGPSSVCLGSVITLTDATSGGTWTSITPSVATVDASGNVTGVAVGSVNIVYSIANSCGTALASQAMTVGTTPTATAISGPTSVCVATTITLTTGTSGGVWTSSSTAAATVGSSTGVVTGVAAGTAVITYTLTNACGSASVVYGLTIIAIPTVGGISGLSSVCPTDSISLSVASSGGTWSSGATSLATVTSTGVVYGINPGTAIISYGVSGVCGTGYATSTITINSLPFAGYITGPTSVCAGDSMVVIDATAGGVWGTGSAAIATVGPTGVVTGVAAGVVNVIYSVSNVCGTVIAAHTISVNTVPDAGTITGRTRICKGGIFPLTASISGGIWSATNNHATVSTAGIVTGVSVGIDTIYHSFTNGCGTSSATFIDTIDASFPTGTSLGTDTICVGDTINAGVTIPFGIWIASNSHAFVSTDGAIIGLTPGIDTIRYTVTNSCGVSAATLRVVIRSAAECSGVAGLKDMASAESVLSLYPNPNQGAFTFNLSSPTNEAVRVVVTDLLGKEVSVINTVSNRQTAIELNVASGVYFVTALTSNGKIVEKIVVGE